MRLIVRGLGVVLLALAVAVVALPPAEGLGQTARVDSAERDYARVDPTAPIPTVFDSLPRPLSSDDAALYRLIFELQSNGKWVEADRLVGRLGDRLLMGHVLAQRFLHPTAYRSSYPELRAWLEHYADHPQAETIHRLAERRKPGGSGPLPEPVAGYLSGSGQELLEELPTNYDGPDGRPAAQSRAVADWLVAVRRLVGQGEPTNARKLLRHEHARFADDVERDLARWFIARGYLVFRKDEEAMELASAAAVRSGHVEPRIHWTAGIAAWRLGEIDRAAVHFAALAEAENAALADVAAGAFWAARAYLRLFEPARYRAFLEIAAEATDGFYGVLAQHVLGRPVLFDWHQTLHATDHMGALLRIEGARRAMALGQIGQKAAADDEIRKLAARANPGLTEALAALAEKLQLPATQMRVAQRARLQDGRRHDGALYPVPPWTPEGGFTIDRALLFAIMRAESGFDPAAESHAGALGVMQILPSTAEAMAKRIDLSFAGPASLHDPKTNLTFGQAYVERLRDTYFIGDSVIHIAAAYNAGLKRAEEWAERYGDIDDPLLLMESIPIPETRLYIKKFMSNLWAYRIKLGQPAPELEALAAGDWPTYVALEQNDPGSRYARAN
jgi:soluble lytic murein transglycosylase-like protein